ncbi:hypothetical protein [uncultured Ramlibacter sp.]|uniref:hypothetical protein n=1 Tax=uncultured Ramlibacter sp. TaxID=260755 RepID=UPI002609561F|nr:hypothetical protein [uncultured Ramlibacter sp.]
MSLMSRLFGTPHSAASGASPPPNARPSQAPATSPSATRKELLRVVLRDTLIKHGIPSTWIGAEMLATSGGGREPGMHLRLLVRHWDPRLLTYSVAFQNSLRQRIAVFDPTALNWFSGLSWQFSLSDESACPDMPNPLLWSTTPHDRPVEPVPATAAAAPDSDARAELERLFAQADADRASTAAPTAAFASTEPAGLR